MELLYADLETFRGGKLDVIVTDNDNFGFISGVVHRRNGDEKPVYVIEYTFGGVHHAYTMKISDEILLHGERIQLI